MEIYRAVLFVHCALLHAHVEGPAGRKNHRPRCLFFFQICKEREFVTSGTSEIKDANANLRCGDPKINDGQSLTGSGQRLNFRDLI